MIHYPQGVYIETTIMQILNETLFELQKKMIKTVKKFHRHPKFDSGLQTILLLFSCCYFIVIDKDKADQHKVV